MGTTTEKLNKVLTTKSELKSEMNKYLDGSIFNEETTTDTIGNTKFADYKNYIKSICTSIFKQAEQITGLFYGNDTVKHCPLIESDTVGNASNIFRESKVVICDGLILPNCTTWTASFNRATSLTTISRFNMSGATSVANMFTSATRLENVTWEGEIKCDMLISATALTHDSLMSMINHLKQDANKTITFGATLKGKLSAEELAMVTAKGWSYDA